MNVDRGLGHCVHHNVHFEFCWSLKERQAYIRTDKPEEEQEIRLANLWVLPLDRLPASVEKAVGKVYVDWEKANVYWGKVNADWDKVIDKHLPAIMAVHNEMVSRAGVVCTWSGTSIFPRIAFGQKGKGDVR